GPEGYARLSRVISEAQLAGALDSAEGPPHDEVQGLGEKGRPVYDLDRVASDLRDHVLVLTGCRKGPVPRALHRGGELAAVRELDRWTARLGPDNVVVELTDHGDAFDVDRIEALAALAARRGLPVVATNNVHYATP